MTLASPDGAAGRVWAALIAHDRWVVLALAVAAALLWLATEPIVFTNDSFGYLGSAKFIIGLADRGVPYYRMPLFPLVLVLTGVARFDTFTWFVVAQTLAGVAMVMIYHDGLRGYSRCLAMAATLVLTLTFVPFVYSKSVMTEQTYLFGLILCLASAIRYFQSGSMIRLALVFGSLLVMMLTRVQGVLIAAVVIPFLFYVRPLQWRSIATATALAAFVMGSYSALYAMQVRGQNLSAAAPAGSLSNSFGKYVFMVPYLDAERHFGWKIVEPSNGPASTRLFSLTEDGPADLSRWWAIWQTLDKKVGVAAANDLLLHVTLEAVVAHPFKAGVLYGHNLAAATYQLNSPYVWEHPPVTIGHGRLDQELRQSGDQASFTWLGRIVNPAFHVAWITATLLALATVGAHGPAWAFCLGLYGYNLCTIAASGAPEGRVVFYALPVLLAALATERSTPWLVRLWRGSGARALATDQKA